MIKRTKTNLGELTLAEYNLGFMRLMNSQLMDPADRPHMFRHIHNVNEDAISYEWQGVRSWSEEVCHLGGESIITWDDYYTIDLARLKLSQQNRCKSSADQQDQGLWESLQDITSEVMAARQAPPCRHFNGIGCTSKTHHVFNGFRYFFFFFFKQFYLSLDRSQTK